MQSLIELQKSYALRAVGNELEIDCPAGGVITAELAIVGEGPGEQEVLRKQPLIGTSGALFWRYANKYGLNRTNCYITNVSKRKIIYDVKGSKIVRNRHEEDAWCSLLRWELLQLPNLKYVLVLGGLALKAIFGEGKINKWRGSVIQNVEITHGDRSRTITAVIANNPANAVRNPETEITFAMDMGKLGRVLNGKFSPHNIYPIINPSCSEAIDYIRSLSSAGEPIAYDIEVISGETACIGLANNAHSGMCINLRDFSENRYTIEEERFIYREIQQLFKDPNVRLIAQNGMFDMTWLWYKDQLHIPRNWFDTMLAHHTLYPSLPHDLGFICTQYTTHPYYKDEKDNWKEGGDINSFWEYNVKDCCITWESARLMDQELERQGMKEFFYSHVMRLQPHLARMTVGGVKIDTELKERIANELREQVHQRLIEFHERARDATGEDADYIPNPGSPKQLSELLFGRLKLVGRGGSTDRENRDRMFRHPRTDDKGRAVIQAINEYAKDKKFLSTYAEMQIDPDGRVRCEYKQTGTQSAPGRLSSTQVMWGSGANLQNQPTRSHPMFIADEGYTMVYFDQEQAEARYVAWDAKIETWIEQFEKARLQGGYDAHRALASDMFKIAYDDVPTADEIDGTKTIRFIAKRCRHGLNYRMAPDRLATTTGLPLDRATEAYNIYHRLTPELRHWWQALENEIRKNKVLYNSFGRRLQLLERITPEALESIVAFRPQSSIGDKVAQVIYEAEDDPRWPSSARMLMNIHDADIALCRVEDARLVASILKKYAEKPMIVRKDMPPLIIPTAIAIAEPDEFGIRRWSTLKKVKDIEAAK